MTNRRIPAHANAQAMAGGRGSSLIEVLVALLLSAIGMLGLAGVLAASVTVAKIGEHRTTAAMLASDLGDRLQASVEEARSGGFDDASGFDPNTPVDPADDCANPRACTSNERAAREMAQWRSRLRTSLPGGDGYVRYDEATEHVDVWVAWLEAGSAVPSPRAASECPSSFAQADPAPRCVHLRVAL